ncbi:cell wall hydrolase [Erythrobacter mangrovi]|uniref:Cell wall hydrolase n=1 Tax=Erythrobacter mangrovi TaxID=2739433 RepID=A0A7D3XAS1_9SPHN|nr:cell wall hydrolase [Erythrobacter mangrovi]QKG71995.1 cell wall hydrolase [Erythrobacter mangrovi]
MQALASSRFRENSPLFGVLALLVLAFAALAAVGHQVPRSLAAAEQAAQAPLEALPASGEDAGILFSTLDPEAARARNAAVGFAYATSDPAPSFHFRGNGVDRNRARDCLALAALAEAGAGDADQRAVMQVVLNRVRHPAFAGTVCGVVFEGSQRPTGCQFTFTCDGSLARTYPESLWRSARARAEEALGGYVDGKVGSATHYHADYVYPAWSGELDKIAAVGPHLFFRWKGAWGSSHALSARYSGGEPDPLALRTLAQEVERPEDLLPRLADAGTAVRSITASDTPRDAGLLAPRPTAPGSPAPGVHFVLVGSGDSPDALVERARALCPGDRYCQVYGWDDPAAIPAKLPLPSSARASLRFSFLPSRSGNGEVAYFDCRLFPAPSAGTCLPRTLN